MAAVGRTMGIGMELAQPLEPTGEDSPLARARVHRQLTLEETARRAGITPEEAQWLEEGRVYRFATSDDALLAALLYGTALGIDNREARELAGLPVPALPAQRNPVSRLIVLGAILIALAVAGAVVLVSHTGGHARAAASVPILPPPWRVDVNVLNGSGDINYTRQVASTVQALGRHGATIKVATRVTAAVPGLLQRSAQARELLLELGGHRLDDSLAHELPQVLLEAVPLTAVAALVEVPLGVEPLRLRQRAVHVRLHPLFAVFAVRHQRSLPTAESAIALFRIRRPRCRRDMTVPTGMSRICAASA